MLLLWLYQALPTSLTRILLTAGLCVPCALVIHGIYNLYFHPLRNVPGPKLGALTDLYAFYWNWIRGVGYSKQFDRWHKHYNSSVIRIGPNDVHTTQVELYDVIHKAGSTWLKDKSFYKHFGGLDAMIDPREYRTYRTHLAPLYSQRAVDGLVSKMDDDLAICGQKTTKMAENGKAVNMARVLTTLSTSMILYNLFSMDISLWECNDYHPFLEAFEHIMAQIWLFLSYPRLATCLSLIPGTSLARLAPSWTTFMNSCAAWCDEDARKQRASDDQSIRDSHSKRYYALKHTDANDKKSIIPAPLDELFSFIAGGTDTTAYTTGCAFFYILSSPSVCRKLVKELDENASFIRNGLDYHKIQTLPYLNAVIKETLRISVPVPGCLPRVVPEGGITVGSFHLPAGTALSITQQAISLNQDIFPSPLCFSPERWIGPAAAGLDKWNVAFGRGSRQCIGTTLAYLELRCVVAYFFSRFDMTLTAKNGDGHRWVDRFVAVNLDTVEVLVLSDRWSGARY
uniref:Inactive cytochrome P450 monooxygenase cloA n=1 Tax=Claviceps fusiformis TaxID=40602 RepID=CLOA_CLAFS|nr:RecName: Full=Inactive cytochrome P450 monooxygenase cloA; AltName: Full=Ergot alkaloid synthesis protein cloA; AltName: Full=Inactive clavine oxidase; Short=CLOA [Claviceps fusiformis]ABV57820.1 cytochrome P450 monooxygenase [Claviceps fusiformis]